MHSIRQSIPDVVLLEPKVFGDSRGFFYESFNQQAFREATGVQCDFVQDNHSRSSQGVLRGLHYQLPPRAQGKLVRVVRGAILDVAVDIRQGSPTYGRHVAAVLSAENWKQLWVPRGFAHGFCTLEPDTEVIYKVDAPYDRACDAGIRWNDPALGIDWPVRDPVLSDKDRVAPLLAEITPPFPQGSW